MKNRMKLALAGAAALSLGMSAQAQFTYNQGDLLVGFTTGSGSDTIYDIGQFSALTVGQSWTLDSGLSSAFGVLGGVQTGSRGTQVTTIYNTFNASDQGRTLVNGAPLSDIQNLTLGATANGTVNGGSVNRYTAPAANLQSWFGETDNPGSTGGTFKDDWLNPNANVGSLAYFFANTVASSGNTAALDGIFNYNSSSGTLTFSAAAVPEPSTYGALSGLGLLALAARRSFRKA